MYSGELQYIEMGFLPLSYTGGCKIRYTSPTRVMCKHKLSIINLEYVGAVLYLSAVDATS